MRTFPARLSRVIDGDTMEVVVDQAFGDFTVVPIRLTWVNAPEKYTAEGPFWTQYVTDWFARHPDFDITIYQTRTGTERKTAGRWLADVVSREGATLTEEMLRDGCPLWEG